MVEVQDVFARYGPAYLESHAPSLQQRKAFDDILACRTAKLGGHAAGHRHRRKAARLRAGDDAALAKPHLQEHLR